MWPLRIKSKLLSFQPLPILRDIWQCLEIFLVVITRDGVGSATGIYWLEARDANKHPTMPRSAPTMISAPNGYSPKVKEPRPRVICSSVLSSLLPPSPPLSLFFSLSSSLSLTHTEYLKLNSLHILEHGCPQRSLYEFPITAVTNYCKLSGVKQLKFIMLQFWRSDVHNASHWVNKACSFWRSKALRKNLSLAFSSF